MAIEIEKKYKITLAQREKVLARLRETGAELMGEDFETNELYGGGGLEQKKAVLRVRKIGERAILTYKRRIKNDSPVKHQIEHETEVANPNELEKIIENLGFEKRLVYEKRRQTWRLDGGEILLDELPFGLFMEIEGSADDIHAIEVKLGAGDFRVEHETYPKLTFHLGEENGKIIEARFTEKS